MNKLIVSTIALSFLLTPASAEALMTFSVCVLDSPCPTYQAPEPEFVPKEIVHPAPATEEDNEEPVVLEEVNKEEILKGTEEEINQALIAYIALLMEIVIQLQAQLAAMR